MAANRDTLREWFHAQDDVRAVFANRSTLEVDAMAWWVFNRLGRRADYARVGSRKTKALAALSEVALRSHPQRFTP